MGSDRCFKAKSSSKTRKQTSAGSPWVFPSPGSLLSPETDVQQKWLDLISPLLPICGHPPAYAQEILHSSHAVWGWDLHTVPQQEWVQNALSDYPPPSLRQSDQRERSSPSFTVLDQSLQLAWGVPEKRLLLWHCPAFWWLGNIVLTMMEQFQYVRYCVSTLLTLCYATSRSIFSPHFTKAETEAQRG